MKPKICCLLVLFLLPSLGVAQPIWQLQNTNFPSDVWVASLSAPSEQVCWAAGQIWSPNNIPYAGYSRTTDGGNTWVCDSIPGAENGYLSQIVALDADTAYAAVYVLTASTSKGVYKTTDGGATWTKQNAYASSVNGPGYIYFFDTRNGVVIGDPGLETYTTTNGGLDWNRVTMPPAVTNEYTWVSGNPIAGAGNRVWFGTTRRLLRSTDRGYTWSASTALPVDTAWYYAIAFQDSNTGIYNLVGNAPVHFYRKTTDGGLTWNDITNLGFSGINSSCIRHVPGTTSTYLITGGFPSGMKGFACTYNEGEDWTVIDYSGNYTIAFASERVGWGAPPDSNGTVYKYVGPSLVGAVESGIAFPASYLLAQNYPNPFNPSTTIRYELPHPSRVSLKVYNTLGQEVATLVNETKPAGVFTVQLDAGGLASGVYFYRIQAGSFVETKKMLVVK